MLNRAQYFVGDFFYGPRDWPLRSVQVLLVAIWSVYPLMAVLDLFFGWLPGDAAFKFSLAGIEQVAISNAALLRIAWCLIGLLGIMSALRLSRRKSFRLMDVLGLTWPVAGALIFLISSVTPETHWSFMF